MQLVIFKDKTPDRKKHINVLMNTVIRDEFNKVLNDYLYFGTNDNPFLVNTVCRRVRRENQKYGI